MKLTFELADQ